MVYDGVFTGDINTLHLIVGLSRVRYSDLPGFGILSVFKYFIILLELLWMCFHAYMLHLFKSFKLQTGLGLKILK